jgi:hypothetical protein
VDVIWLNETIVSDSGGSSLPTTYQWAMSNCNSPALLKNSSTVLRQWKALQKWPQRAYLRSHHNLATLRYVKAHGSKDIVYYDRGFDKKKTLFSRVSGVPKAKRVDRVIDSLPFDEFLASCSKPSDQPPFMYLNDELRTIVKRSFQSPNLLDDLHPMSTFMNNATDDARYIGLWMGCRGVTTCAHYDMSHNLFVQLVGEKTFIMVSASRVFK